MIGCPHLDAGGRYERSVEGWVDASHADAFTHTVRIADATAAVELALVANLPPDYTVREARGAVTAGAADAELPARLAGLAGARMVAGFTRRLAELAGDRPGAGLFVDAGIEAARLARQVTRLPAETLRGIRPGDPAGFWKLDTTGFPELPNSCFTYSAAGRALFDARQVQSAMTPALYGPPVGTLRVFVRRKLVRLVRTGSRLHLFHAMHDNVHGFDVHYEVDLDDGTIAAADSVVSRVPYGGICSEPQGRIGAMVGQRVDAGLRKRIQALLGGAEGCAQLYDLTSDLLKLVAVPDAKI